MQRIFVSGNSLHVSRLELRSSRLRACRVGRMSRVRLDPCLRLGVDFTRIATGGGDRRADDDADGAGLLHQPAARPVVAGIVRHRHDQPPVSAASSAPLTPYLRVSPGGMRVPSGKITTHSPSASRALPCSITLRTAVGPAPRSTAIARSWRDAPADERDPGQLALEHPDLRRQQHRLRDGLPARGMLHQRDVIAGGQPLARPRRDSRAGRSSAAPRGSPAPRPAPARSGRGTAAQAGDRQEDRVDRTSTAGRTP